MRPPPGEEAPTSSCPPLVPLQTDQDAVGVDVPEVPGGEGEGQAPLLRQGKAARHSVVVRGQPQQAGDEGLVGAVPLAGRGEGAVEKQLGPHGLLT